MLKPYVKDLRVNNMSTPTINDWYQDVTSGRSFRVVAIDEDNDAINVQFEDGDIGEYDFNSWYDSNFTSTDAPEDWSAPFGGVEVDDLNYTDTDIHAEMRDISLDDFLDVNEL